MLIKMGETCAVGPRTVKAFSDGQAGHWERRPHHNTQKLRYIMRVLDLHAGQRVLDVACGTGVLFPWLLPHKPALLMGIDISEAVTEEARVKYKDKRLRIVTADYYHLAAGAFDRIILYNAYQHFFDKEKLAQKTFDLLADGGRFVVAHSMGRISFNGAHEGQGDYQCCMPIQPADGERGWFEPYFAVDSCIDNEEIYIISGAKRG